ncbi:MAG: leucine-rich repeat domain-containing protein [Saccharofermentanales bacterium]
MKKELYVVLAALTVISLSACGTPAAKETLSSSPGVSESVSEEDSESIVEPTPEPLVVFTDTVLETKVREAIGKQEGNITIAEAEAVTVLDLSMDPEDWSIPRINDISSLQYFTNLTSLNLAWALNSHDAIVDISPLSGLTKLEALYINSNGIADISALADMTDMLDLKIWGNDITDIQALSGMTKMQDLWMQGNQITDISPLSGMTKDLCRLYIDDNQITDVTPIAGMTKLTSLKVAGNPVEDYSPLAGIYPKLEEKDFEIWKHGYEYPSLPG